MNVNSLRDEIRFLFSGQGMPYEKVCLMVAAVVCIVLGTMPIVANVKNIEPKKNRKPCTSTL